MIIGNFQPYGRMVLNKWLIGLEIRKCPPTMSRVFKPHIRVFFIKFTDHGEPGKFDGRPQKKIGGWWTWTCPFGISIEII